MTFAMPSPALSEAKLPPAKVAADAVRVPDPARGKGAAGAGRGGCACGGSCPRCNPGKGLAGQASPLPLKPLQAKLRIGARHDPLEQEADAVAARIIGMPAPARQSQPAPRISSLPAQSRLASTLRAEGGPAATMPVAAGTQSAVDALHGGGAPLSPESRAYFEPRFGRDLSGVRLHTGSTAAMATEALAARAFTVGNDIAFAPNQYQPASEDGRRLLAHELAHTVQQGAAGSSRVQRVPADLDFSKLARRIHDAIDGPGTDEEAVYAALQQLERDPAAIAKLEATYQNDFKLSLRADIDGDFSGEELEYAMQLINGGTAGSEQRIENGPNAIVSVATAIERLWAATDRIGTDEEAIFATLLPFGRNTGELEDAFEKRYGDNLRATLVSELGGTELDYAMSLMAPEGERRLVVDMLSPTLIAGNFSPADRDLAGRILRDLIAVRGDRLDFSSEQELVAEIRKRMRTSQLMQESQTGSAFDYPESMTSDCAGYTTDIFQQASAHARVNKDAAAYWQPRELDSNYTYFFRLSALGRGNAFEAIRRLFTDQRTICDKTLIHCDYLITVIHFRTYAESLGAPAFNELVRNGRIDPVLTYTGFPNPPEDMATAPRAWSLQEMRPASEDDLVIGDHVIFWNHLAYDAITVAMPGPWRLENALLVDKNSAGDDLYEGHGAPVLPSGSVGPGSRDLMLGDLRKVYDDLVGPAIDLAREVDAGIDPNKPAELAAQYPQVTKQSSGDWVIRELDDRPGNQARQRRTYPLRKLSGINDPDLIGLRDPDEPSKMNWVKRPIESAPGPKPVRS